MIRNSVFKYAIFGILISAVLTALSLWLNMWVTKVSLEDKSGPTAPIFTQAVRQELENTAPENRAAILEKLEFGNRRLIRRVLLVNEDGQVVFPARINERINLNAVEQMGSNSGWRNFLSGKESRSKILLPGQPVQYLLLERRQTTTLGIPKRQWTAFGILVVALSCGILATLMMVFLSIREKAQVAGDIMVALKRGQLKARIPTGRMDELSLMAHRFNDMATEVERLVYSLKKSEDTRGTLLRELAHDLKTPIAAMNSSLETLRDKGDQLTSFNRDKLFALALREVEYFGSLVEDLLLLGVVSDPGYRTQAKTISLQEIAYEESEALKSRSAQVDFKVVSDREYPPIIGNEMLLRRMIRNSLENAQRYAKSEVSTTFSSKVINGRSWLELTIRDDGTGFSELGMATYGRKRATRTVEENGGKRISLGLGSVIIRTVAEAHGGQIMASNRIASGGNTVGAKVIVTLPLI